MSDSCVADDASGGYHPHSKVGRNRSGILGGFEVVGICDPLKPLRRSVRAGYLNCDMQETLVRCPTEPVFDIRIDEDGIARGELPCGTPPLLSEPCPFRDDEYLPSPRFGSVDVPIVAAEWLECAPCRPDWRPRQWVQITPAGEVRRVGNVGLPDGDW